MVSDLLLVRVFRFVVVGFTTMMLCHRSVRAFAPHQGRRSYHPSRVTTALMSFVNDDQGRKIRKRENKEGNESSSWDKFDPLSDDNPTSSTPSRTEPYRQANRDRSRFRDDNAPSSSFQQRRAIGKRRDETPDDEQRRINLKALENAGFVHLYGLAPVAAALSAQRRDLTRPEDRIDLNALKGTADYEHELRQREHKPEAQFSPWLFVQERHQSQRSTQKSMQYAQILQLAAARNLPIATVDKGVLNTLSGNRPHQGVCLRCGDSLEFTPLTQIPAVADATTTTTKLWLVLDEVVDPQNLGALLRSAYFMGHVNVLVCAKNSAPPSPVVSAASAGALELMTVYSTSNLPRTLAAAEQDGFRIIGASSSSSVKDLDDIPIYDLQDLPPPAPHDDKPTILVLGSEGHGLRPLVAKSCTSFVRIPSGSETAHGGMVDSLNVSVTGGILLWHLILQLNPR